MKSRAGFTLIELIITMSVMVILMALAVINLTNSQTNARDTQRSTDMANFARSLETFYNVGSTNDSTRKGTYPSLADLFTNGSFDSSKVPTVLPDLDLTNLQAPGVGGTTYSLLPATNNNESPTGVTPQPTIAQYVYQPIGNVADGNNSTNACQNDDTATATCSLCLIQADNCIKFNLFYRSEISGTVQEVTSNHRS